MEKDFDFKEIGKRIPFRTPEGFFERMQAETLKRVAEEKRRKKLYRLRWGISTALVAAAMICGFIFYPSAPRKRRSRLLLPNGWLNLPMKWTSTFKVFPMKNWKIGSNSRRMIYFMN